MPAAVGVMTCLFYIVCSDVAVKCKSLQRKREKKCLLFNEDFLVVLVVSVWCYITFPGFAAYQTCFMLHGVVTCIQNTFNWDHLRLVFVSLNGQWPFAKHRWRAACLVKCLIWLSCLVPGSCFDLVCLVRDPKSVCFVFCFSWQKVRFFAGAEVLL